MLFIFFFKQKTAYEMRISDWSSDVCSSDLTEEGRFGDPDYQRELTADELTLVETVKAIEHFGLCAAHAPERDAWFAALAAQSGIEMDATEPADGDDIDNDGASADDDADAPIAAEPAPAEPSASEPRAQETTSEPQ